MSQPYIAQIAIFGFNFAPVNWVLCNGALMSIAQNSAFYAVIGTTYGGDGQSTFGVPNTGNCAVLNQGQGPGLSNYSLGEITGFANVTLTSQQMPLHTHVADGTAGSAYGVTVANGSWMGQAETGNAYLFAPSPDGGGVNLAPTTISIVGGSLPHTNEQPYLGMNFCIAQYGIFPSRN